MSSMSWFPRYTSTGSRCDGEPAMLCGRLPFSVWTWESCLWELVACNISEPEANLCTSRVEYPAGQCGGEGSLGEGGNEYLRAITLSPVFRITQSVWIDDKECRWTYYRGLTRNLKAEWGNEGGERWHEVKLEMKWVLMRSVSSRGRHRW